MKKPSKQLASTPVRADDDLERQEAYAEALERSNHNFGLVLTESFIRGMRENGYRSTATAVDEFIDNSIQAGARNVHVLFGGGQGDPEKKPSVLAVVDDGHGMGPRMLRAAVTFGGTHRENDRNGFGRYGFGLPSAAVSIGRRYTVLSRPTGGGVHALTVDLDDIAAGKFTTSQGIVVAPHPRESEFPSFVLEQVPALERQGTVILIEKPDRLTSGFRTTRAMKQNFLHHVGLVYRSLLRHCAIHIDGTRVEALDPLFLDASARFVDRDGSVARAGEPAVVPVKDRATRRGLGSVRIRSSFVDPGKIDARPRAEDPRFKIMKATHGLVVTRAGRQIDVVTALPWTKLQNNDVYCRIELDFDPSLDEFFGVTTNKQQITISEEMWDILAEAGLPAQLKALRTNYREWETQNKASALADQTKDSEEVMQESERFVVVPKAVRSNPLKKAKAVEALEREVETQARDNGRRPEEIEAEIQGRPYRVCFETLPGAPFYRSQRLGNQLRLYINDAHRFFSDVYAAPDATRRTQSAVELLMFVLASSEDEADGDRELFYNAERQEWSKQLDICLRLLDQRSPPAERRDSGDEI